MPLNASKPLNAKPRAARSSCLRGGRWGGAGACEMRRARARARACARACVRARARDLSAARGSYSRGGGGGDQ